MSETALGGVDARRNLGTLQHTEGVCRMSHYFYANYDTNTWQGPVDGETIRGWVVQGEMSRLHLVVLAEPNAVPIAAEHVPPSGPDLYEFLLTVGALGLGGWGAYKAYEYFRGDPERRAIQQSAERLLARGAEVYADLPGWPKPPVINGHIPDLYAVLNKRVVMAEYENEVSVSRSHARSQDRAFSAFARSRADVRYRQIVVEGGRGGHG
jgi:hypothetical protein